MKITYFLLGVGSTVLAGLILAWFTGALQESGRRWSSNRHARRAERNAAESEAVQAAQAERDRQSRDLASQMEIKRLRGSRIGVRFRWRASANDPGMMGTIVDLDSRSPKERVIMQFSSPDGREPTPRDFSDHRTSVEWEALNRSVADQRHRTARTIAHSCNDDNGWVEFERLP